jgi:ATP-dependent phosphoenolpyruvate carboxykinase
MVKGPSRQVHYASSALTENTRASYPITYIDNARIPCVGPHPRNVVLLCCDAFGVLPPVSRLTLEQAMYHFISGYTSKVGNRWGCGGGRARVRLRSSGSCTTPRLRGVQCCARGNLRCACG